MIVAHLADLHLGFRAYGRVESDMDIRERDVSAAFERAVGTLVELAPDVVVVAGDVFDRPDPPAGAVVALARGLEVLRTSLPDTPVLMVAGPRDTPRRAGDPGALAVLDTFSNVEAATSLTRTIYIDRLDLMACLVPHRAVTRHPPVPPEPDPRTRWNLLVVHGRIAERARQEGIHVNPAEWSYVALGGEHRRRAVSDRARYAGSLERVALDPWDEATDQTGFLTVDLERGTTTFHPIPGRPVVALAPIKVGPGDPDRLRRRVREVAEEVPGGIEGKIVRVRLEGALPRDLLALQGEPLDRLRGQALHFAVEAGREPRTPADPWEPGEAGRRLLDAALAELERGGTDPDQARARLTDLVDGAASADDGPLAPLETLDGEVPGCGRVSTSFPPGLTAVFGGGARTRRSVADFLRAQTPGDGPLERLWRGDDTETLDGAFQGAVEAVAQARGLSVIDAALRRAGVDAGPVRLPAGSAGAVGSEAPESAHLREELDGAERTLRALRADAAEIDGDLEVATMDWLRERQDAETTLHAYRDRARELRARLRQMVDAGPDAPCPTCGRVLAAHYEEVRRELEEEWEGLVQDGSWWRSRWAQLELKPAHLRDLEARAVRMHAAMEAESERVEMLKTRLGQRGGAAMPSVSGAPMDEVGRAVVDSLTAVREGRIRRAAETVLDRASRFLCRMSGGRILAVTEAEGRPVLQGGTGALRPLAEEDLASGRLALRLAAASLVATSGGRLPSLVLEDPFDRLDEEARSRTLLLLRALLRDIPRVLLVTRGAAVDARPELFDYLLEVRSDGVPSGPVVRPVPAGPGWVDLRPPLAEAPSGRGTGRARPGSPRRGRR